MFLTPVLAVTETEVKNELLKLSPNIAPGIDMIPSKIPESSPENILKPLTYVYNLSFLNACVPDCLKIAKVIHIYKKKEKYLNLTTDH